MNYTVGSSKTDGPNMDAICNSSIRMPHSVYRLYITCIRKLKTSKRPVCCGICAMTRPKKITRKSIRCGFFEQQTDSHIRLDQLEYETNLDRL